jgi:hypothetical protein
MAYKDTFNGNRQKLLDALKAAGMLGLDSREVAALGLGAAHSRMAELDEFHIIQRKDLGHNLKLYRWLGERTDQQRKDFLWERSRKALDRARRAIWKANKVQPDVPEQERLAL